MGLLNDNMTSEQRYNKLLDSITNDNDCKLIKKGKFYIEIEEFYEEYRMHRIFIFEELTNNKEEIKELVNNLPEDIENIDKYTKYYWWHTAKTSYKERVNSHTFLYNYKKLEKEEYDDYLNKID